MRNALRRMVWHERLHSKSIRRLWWSSAVNRVGNSPVPTANVRQCHERDDGAYDPGYPGSGASCSAGSMLSTMRITFWFMA